MTEDKQGLATLLYELTDDLILDDPEGESISIDKLLNPQQKYSLIMSILNGLPMDSFERVIDFNKVFNMPTERTHILEDFEHKEYRFRLIAEELLELGFSLGLDRNDVYRILIEEFQKVVDKKIKPSLAETLDALTDILFVTYGAFYTFNLIPIQEKAMEEVYDSNLTKLIPNNNVTLRTVTESITELKAKGHDVISRDINSTYVSLTDRVTGKILKPLTYIKPNLQSIINKYFKNN